MQEGNPMLGRPATSCASLVGLLFLLTISASVALTQTGGAPCTKAEFAAKISSYFAWPHPNDYNDIWKTPIKPG
jgi:hypothetical protein